MAQPTSTTFTDGFPNDTLSAINQSYFLSDTEKQEWRDWIQTATDEQKTELVDILHSMWEDNQKSVVPDSFSSNSGQAPALNPAPQQPPRLPPAPAIDTPAEPVQPAPKAPPAVPSFEEFLAQQNQSSKAPTSQALPPLPDFNFPPAETAPRPAAPSLPSFNTTTPASPIPTATPLQNDPFKSPIANFNPTIASPIPPATTTQPPLPQEFTNQQFVAAPIPEPIAPPSAQALEPTVEKEEIKPQLRPVAPIPSLQPAPVLQPVSETKTEDIDELNLRSLGKTQAYTPNPILENPRAGDISFSAQTSKQRPATTPRPNLDEKNGDLEHIYQDYVQTFEGNQKKFMDLLKGVTQNLGSYQSLRDDLDVVREKSLQINDKVIAQNQKIQQIETITSASGKSSLQDQIDALQIQLEALNKEFRTFQLNTKEFVNRTNQVIAGYKGDSYGGQKVEEKLSLLENHVRKLEKNWSSGNSKVSSDSKPKKNQFSTQVDDQDEFEDSTTITKTSQVDLRGVL